MQMALMDSHVAEAHADGADGLPRSWSTFRWRLWITTWLKQMPIALMDYHVSEAHSDGADGLPIGCSTCRWRWWITTWLKHMQMSLARSYTGDTHKSGAEELWRGPRIQDVMRKQHAVNSSEWEPRGPKISKVRWGGPMRSTVRRMALPKYSVVNPDGAEEAWPGLYIQDGEGKNRIASEEAQLVYKNHHITCKIHFGK